MDSICSMCGKSYIYDRSKGHRKSKCGTCNTTSSRSGKRDRLKQEWGGCCLWCKYDTYLGALEFHHVDPAQKEFGIAKGWNKSESQLRKEMEKCVLLCSNCHKELGAGLIDVLDLVKQAQWVNSTNQALYDSLR